MTLPFAVAYVFIDLQTLCNESLSKLMFDVGNLNLKFDFEVEVLDQNWGLTLKFEALDKRLTLKPEVKVSFKGLKFNVLSKSLKLRFQVEV